MAGTMTTASGQSILFMITHSVAVPGPGAPEGHWELYPKTSGDPRPPGWSAATACATLVLTHVERGYII
jgi:hypothetical protein